MLTWQTLDKTNRRQWLIWISASSRLSGDANGRRRPKRSKWSTCCTMPPSTMRYVSLFKSQNLPHNTQNEFQSYNGGDITCYGHLLIDVKDKVTKKYHPIRFYVMNTDVLRILISHAASYWLGLVKVLCDNKAPRIKRQVASIDKKSDFRVKSGPFRTSTSNTASSSQKKQMTPKTVTSGKVHVPSPRMQSFEDAKIQGGKRATGVRPGRDVDVSDGEQ